MSDINYNALPEKTTPSVSWDKVLITDSEDWNIVKIQEALLFKWPQGEQWEQGIQGIQWIQWIQGIQWEQWEQGIQWVPWTNAPELEIEYSIDWATLWHTPFTSWDFYQRVSTDWWATWSSAIKFVWEDWTWSWDMLKSENLSWLTNYATARSNLWLDTTANQTDSTDKRFMTDAQENKLDWIEALAEVNNISDVNATDLTDWWVTSLHTHNTSLDDLVDVAIVLPITQGQSLVYNGVEWINANPTPAVWSASTLYLDATSTIADNLYLNTSPSSFPQTIKTSIVNANIDWWIWFLERFVSWPLWRTNIPAWDWTFNTYASTSNNNWTNTIQVRVNKRVEISWMTWTFTWAWTTRTFTVTWWTPFVPWDAWTNLTASLIETPTQSAWISTYISSSKVIVTLTDSWYVNETWVALNAIYYLLFNSWETSDITWTSPVNYVKTITQPAFVANPTDRIVTAYFAKTTSWTARTIWLYYWGTAAYSNVKTPINTNHNDLWWLNEWEFIHLTTAEKAKLDNQSWTNTWDQTTISWISGTKSEFDTACSDWNFVFDWDVIPVSDWWTWQSTAQEAINALTAVSWATNEYVLTKDTATWNAIFKAVPSSWGLSSLWKARAVSSSATSCTSGVFTKITLWTESFDTLWEFDNVTNYRYTASVTWIYNIVAIWEWGWWTWTSSPYLTIYKNWVRWLYELRNSVSVATKFVYTDNISLTSWDYIELYMRQDTWASTNAFWTLCVTRLA